MILQGKNINQICDYLNKRNILPSSTYKSYITKVTSKNTLQASEWKLKMIISIIHNKSYVGTLTQGKHARENFKTHKFIKTDSSNWVESKNHHEAIIDDKSFTDANNILWYPSNSKREDEYLLPYLRCRECKGRFTIIKGKSKEYYYCNNYIRKKICVKNYVAKKILEDMVLKIKEKYNNDNIELSKDLIRENVRTIYVFSNGKIEINFLE